MADDAFGARRRDDVLGAIVRGGLVAGACDLLGAFAYYARSVTGVVRVMQSIAGGVLGRAASEGGAASAVLGVVLHFTIATVWAAIFVLAATRLRALIAWPVVSGVVYGVVVYYAMNVVVLPLSALGSRAWPPPFDLWVILIHMVGVGLPIALIARARLQGR